MTMSEIRFRSSVAERIFGPRAKACAEASSPDVIRFLCPSRMCESAVSFLFLAWASRSIQFRTSSRLQNSLILPTIVPAKLVWRFNSSGGRVAVSVGALMSLTANTAGYHGAHAVLHQMSPAPPHAIASSSLTGLAASAQGVTNTCSSNNIPPGYCWTHGLTKNHEHTSATCANPVSGHQKTATLHKRMGGSGRMFSDGTRRNRPSASLTNAAVNPIAPA